MFGYYYFLFKSENALLNRNVFSCFLKELMEVVVRMASGRLFQLVGDG